MPTQPIVKNRNFNQRQIKRIFIRRLAIVTWVSFLAAAVQTMVFFALFDPVYLGQLSSWPAVLTHWQGYAMGFAFFWFFSFISGFVIGIVMALPRTQLAKKSGHS